MSTEIVPTSYLEVWNAVPKDAGILIGIDGDMGEGKSTLAAWLSWQYHLHMPPAMGGHCLNLDLFMYKRHNRRQWRISDIRSILNRQRSLKRTTFVEGINLLETLERAEYSPDFLIWVYQGRGGTVADTIANSPNLPEWFLNDLKSDPRTIDIKEYQRNYDPKGRSDYQVQTQR